MLGGGNRKRTRGPMVSSRAALLAVASLFLCAAPAWVNCGHGHGHAKRRSGGLLSRMRRTTSQQILAEKTMVINDAVSSAMSAAKGATKNVGNVEETAATIPLRKK